MSDLERRGNAPVIPIDELRERLHYHSEHPVTGRLVLTNPDGPRAATALAFLLSRIEELERELAEARSVINPMIDELQAICERHGCLGGQRRTTFIAEKMDAQDALLRRAAEALGPFAEAIAAYDAKWNDLTDGQPHPDGEDEDCVIYLGWLGEPVAFATMGSHRTAQSLHTEITSHLSRGEQE